jgi:hypothetical protein
MIKCVKCSEEKDIINFIKAEKSYKECIDCRNKIKEWRDNNKKRISLYNKMCVINKKNKKEYCALVYGKKTNEDVWKEYKTQSEAAKLLNLHSSNINKVIKGCLKTTGGYEFKIENIITPKIDIPSWEEIKLNNGFYDMVKGQPSNHRILHEEKDSIMGKCCCTCKEWKALTDFNKAKSHWDKLRNECKECLINWRKQNRKELNKKHKIYEKNRKLIDPEFKIVKILRSRLASVLHRKNIIKHTSTLALTGCELPFLKEYLESKFTEGMTWENHGEWHIDHIRPCISFDLKHAEEQQKCFHYTNLQPLWASENLKKGSKYKDVESI